VNNPSEMAAINSPLIGRRGVSWAGGRHVCNLIAFVWHSEAATIFTLRQEFSINWKIRIPQFHCSRI
jgi:hypothetical protein